MGNKYADTSVTRLRSFSECATVLLCKNANKIIVIEKCFSCPLNIPILRVLERALSGRGPPKTYSFVLHYRLSLVTWFCLLLSFHINR